MSSHLKYQKFLISEQVFVSPDFRGKVDRAAYSLPDVLDIKDAKTLVNFIEGDTDLRGIALGELMYAKVTPSEFWGMIQKHPIGKQIVSKHPDITKYRISRTDTTRDEYKEPTASTEDPKDPHNKKVPITPFEKYDKWANQRGISLTSKEMPSFQDWVRNPSIWNPEEVSGRTTKMAPVSVATIKQTPPK